ncbi:hypothetical protein [Streptomyces shenzhenensis]|uniref:DUF916 domain-containing protein n=1 Tax=Streptomyces shenzhenensis TaxID=943815 RepID=A0A3M0I8K6_9ACTN|nr:hypothetical protein [Streptomyces shenzhenensis]RMB84652.1 hypothetical protein CTZ28_18220 [Streptomyces shenzhenensis]
MPSAARALCLSLLTLLPLLGAAPTTAAAGRPGPVTGPGQSPPAAGPTGWSLAPAGGGRPSFYAEGTPGTVLRDTVSVTNRSAEPVTLRLRGTGLRVTFAGTGVRVPARTRADVPFTVAVPTAAGTGDRSGTIVAQDGHGGTRTVRIRLRVGGPALSALTVEKPAVHADRITYELVNRGTTVLVPRLAVRADGVFGRVLDRAPRTLPVRLAPGRRLRLSEPWPDRPALDAVDVRLTVTAPGGARATADTSVRFVPWGAIGAGAAVVAGAAAALAVRRRGRGRRTAGAEDEVPRTEIELTGAVM